MRTLKIKPHLTDEELRDKMNSQKSIHDFKNWQIIYSVQTNPGKKGAEIAEILGMKMGNLYKKVQTYNKLGASWRDNVQRGGRREARCIMTLSEEKEFLKSVEEEALRGGIITYQQIKSRLENAINRTVSDDYVWDIFKRHNWKKKTPRQSHPKADKSAQEEFKKNSQRIWLPKS
jgi:transposase